jgi:hypothetical protein
LQLVLDSIGHISVRRGNSIFKATVFRRIYLKGAIAVALRRNEGRKRQFGLVLSETSREAFGQAIPPKSLQDEIDKDARFGREQRAGRVIQ